MSPWIWLAVAIVFEVAGTLLLKASRGFENLALGMAAIACYSVCFWFFAPALKVIPAGVAYAVWAGVGIAAVSLISWLAFGQSLSTANWLLITLILAGAIGLNLTAEIK